MEQTGLGNLRLHLLLHRNKCRKEAESDVLNEQQDDNPQQ
jgi:hypothetical protein